jgi:hypothetical protein
MFFGLIDLNVTLNGKDVGLTFVAYCPVHVLFMLILGTPKSVKLEIFTEENIT